MKTVTKVMQLDIPYQLPQHSPKSRFFLIFVILPRIKSRKIMEKLKKLILALADDKFY